MANSAINKFGGCSFYRSGNDFYIVGADSVSKKLGNGKIFKTSLSTSYTWMTSYSVNLSAYIDWYKEVNYVLAALKSQNAPDSNLTVFNYSYDASSGLLSMSFSSARQPSFEIMVASIT